MNKKVRRVVVLFTGWGLVTLGFVGLFLPFLQGVLFLLAGITILSAEYAWARKVLRKLREQFPTLSSRLDLAKARAQAWLKRIAARGSGGA